MTKEERFGLILKELKTSGKVSFEAVASQLQVSEDTVRRDIDALSKNGLLVKVRGGAMAPSANPLLFQDREELFSDAKKIIALKALQQLAGCRTVFMDGGTTMLAVAASLPADTHLRVITHNMALVPVLGAHPGVELIVLGGQYDRATQTNLGVQTCLEAARYQADLYLMGVCSADPAAGITAAVAADGEVKKAVLASSLKTLALVNHEKLNTVDFFRVCELAAIDGLITELPSDDPRLDGYRAAGVELV